MTSQSTPTGTFVKRRIPVEAWKWEPGAAVPEGCEIGPTFTGAHSITIVTLEGEMTVHAGDWIVKGVEGEFYPVRADIFARTYEPEDESPEPLRERWGVADFVARWGQEWSTQDRNRLRGDLNRLIERLVADETEVLGTAIRDAITQLTHPDRAAEYPEDHWLLEAVAVLGSAIDDDHQNWTEAQR